LNGAAMGGATTANMTDDIRAWSVGPDGVSGTADDVGYSNQVGAFGIRSREQAAPERTSIARSYNQRGEHYINNKQAHLQSEWVS
jgi:hypothetical protein